MSRTWLITGVSSGFGYEMTKQLLEKGDVVIGTVRNTAKVEDLIQKYPVNFDCRILDVTDVAAVQQTVKESFEKHGKMICTPKVRHFWRCIFLWQRKGKNIENTRQNSNYLL